MPDETLANAQEAIGPCLETCEEEESCAEWAAASSRRSLF
jgi:hypothetical protein